MANHKVNSFEGNVKIKISCNDSITSLIHETLQKNSEITNDFLDKLSRRFYY